MVLSTKCQLTFSYLVQPGQYRLKDLDSPTTHLGATIGRYKDPGLECWYSPAKDYLESALPVIERRFDLSKIRAKQPLPTSCHPELANFPELNEDDGRL